MSKWCTLTPAYGRDYKSTEAIREALNLNADFYFHDITSPWDGKICNLQDLKKAGYTHVEVRYVNNRKVATFDLQKFV